MNILATLLDLLKLLPQAMLGSVLDRVSKVYGANITTKILKTLGQLWFALKFSFRRAFIAEEEINPGV